MVRDGPLVRLRVTSAGHPPPLVVRRSGAVEEAPTRGTLVGAFHEISSTTAEVVLEPGETGVFFQHVHMIGQRVDRHARALGQRRLEPPLPEHLVPQRPPARLGDAVGPIRTWAGAISPRSHHPAHRPPAPHLGRVTVACVDGEWHALPARLVAEVLRRRGWEVGFLGAHVRTAHLVADLHASAPRAVALSCALPRHLPTAHRVVAACQNAGFPVLAGGRAFGTDGRYARALGADGWAPDALGAADVLASGLAGSLPRPGHRPVDDLPHLADQEHAVVSRARQELVRSAPAGLDERFPPMREYSDAQRDRTAEDVAHIVDHLAAAVYVDDDALFTEFLSWTAEVLSARGVPAAGLVPTLELLAAALPPGTPRANRVLTAGHRALTPAPRH